MGRSASPFSKPRTLTQVQQQNMAAPSIQTQTPAYALFISQNAGNVVFDLLDRVTRNVYSLSVPTAGVAWNSLENKINNSRAIIAKSTTDDAWTITVGVAVFHLARAGNATEDVLQRQIDALTAELNDRSGTQTQSSNLPGRLLPFHSCHFPPRNFSCFESEHCCRSL